MKTKANNKITANDRTQIWVSRGLWRHIRVITAQEDGKLLDVTERILIAGLRALKYPEFRSQSTDRVA